jgi:ATP-independent RNA helicase DbpA
MDRFNLPIPLINKLKQLDITTPTLIQELTIPHILNAQDIFAKAPTSAGKTLAFLLPIIAKCDIHKQYAQKLIITPTRELASQIDSVLKLISTINTALLCGGVSFTKHTNILQTNPQIIIATPGRLIDIINQRALDLSHIDTLVLDEADRMLDMGFFDDILYISSNLSSFRQTLLFSATYPEKIKLLSQKILKSPKVIEIDTQRYKIKEIGYEITNRYFGVKNALISHHNNQTIIFCNTKDRAIELSSNLKEDGFDVVEFHGGLIQSKRDEALILFTNKTKPILVATDLASRGLDIVGVDCVIGYDVAFDVQTYTHRKGRCSRDSNSGVAISLYHHSQKDHLFNIAPHIQILDLPKSTNAKPIVSLVDTVVIAGGKKSKLRKGDIVGAMCKSLDIASENITQIDIKDTKSYVALSGIDIQTLPQKIVIKKRKFNLFVV